MQGTRAPNVTPQQTLAPSSGIEAMRSPEAPFAVVAGSPQGATEVPSEISIVFNRPMRPLELAGEETPAPVTMSPIVPGRWQWVGTNALQFVPEGRLPRATQYRVTVPKGTRALDGSTLEKAYELAFSTVRPRLVETEPGTWEALEPSATFTLRFNQPIADMEIRRAISILVGPQKRAAAFDVRRPEPKNQMLAVLVPKQKLPKDSAILIHASADLRGTEGNLPAGKEQEETYRTYGPLAVDDISCDTDTPHGNCAPTGGVGIRLTNPVKLGDLKRALAFEPAVEIQLPDWDDDEPVESLWVRGKFVPGKTYRLLVRASLPGGGALTDKYGQALASEFSKSLKMDDLWPKVEIGVAGTYLEPGNDRVIPVFAVNTDYELAVTALDENQVLALESGQEGSRSGMRLLTSKTKAKAVAVRPKAAKNVAAKEIIRPEQVLGGKEKRGPIAVATSYLPRPITKKKAVRLTEELRVVQVTNLGITAKVSQEGSLVWVTKLGTGEPVANASVEIRRPDSTSGVFRTDKDGIATIPQDKFRPRFGAREDAVIFVRDQEDWTYRQVSHDLNTYQFGARSEYGPEEGAIGMIFTERGLYRPGDVVKVKGIVRKPEARGMSTPAGQSVSLTVSGPEGDPISQMPMTLSEFGTFSFDVTVPRTGKLGHYQIEAKLEEKKQRWADFYGSFQVAEYRPAEFKVTVASDKPSYIRGDKAQFTGHGDFLFGAPMSHADAHYRVTRAPAWYAVPGLPDDFSTTDEPFLADLTEMAPESHLLASGESKLDDKGELELTALLALPGQRGPERVTCEVEVTDLSRQTLAGGSTEIVHPGEFYVALRSARQGFVEAKKPLKIDVLAVDPKGARKAQVGVHLELVKRTWSLARQTTGGSEMHSVVHPVDTVVSGCDVKTGAEPVSCELVPPSGGYYLVRAKAKDGRGNPIASSIGLYALGEGAGGFGDNDQLKVDLALDRTSYEVGQTAKILVKSPFKTADALVTVERAGIYSQKRVTLSGAMPVIEVPITDDLRPNAFVSVVLLRGRTKEAPENPKEPDVGAPAFRLGYAELVIDPASRRFQVAVKPNKTELSPGEPVEVEVDVRDKAGKGTRAEMTLYAVDEGVLSLIGYKTPDPVPVFNAPRPLRVLAIESREDLARVISAEALMHLEKGYEGGGGSDGVRRDFRQSVYFNPSVVTDDNGRAKVSFKLPDSLTTYRIMAVAVGRDDRFGFGENQVVASKKLMARPAFPRFLRAGDKFDAGIVVSSKGLGKTAVEVEASADGLVLGGASKQTIQLEPNGSQEVRFAFQAPHATKAKIAFRVKGGGASDAVEIRRDVQAPAVLESVALYGETTGASGEALGDMSGMRSDVGGLDVALSSTALVGLGAGIEQLIEYPYGCIEQQTSRLVPLVTLRELARDFRITLPANADEIVTSTVAKILAAQQGDGGFGFWPDSPESNPWVTTYALFGLGEAKRHGVPIPERAIEAATTYVRRQLEEWQKTDLGPATAAFIVDVLAMNGASDPGWESRLFEAREKLPLFGRALLAHAMATSKSHPKAQEELARELSNHLRLDGPVARAAANVGDQYAVLMDSETRTTALVLRALVTMQPNTPLAARLAKGLLADRQGGTWRSTQETAWALLALDDYRKAQEKTAPSFDARVFLGEKEVFKAAFQGRDATGANTAIAADNLVSQAGSTLAFQVEGRGTLFYEARLKYARKELPKEAIDRGFFVKQTLRAVRPEELAEAIKQVGAKGATSFFGSDLVLADVVVVTPSPREQVVIDAPLPAGFEPIDASLVTTANWLSVPATGGEYEALGDDEGARDELAEGRAYLPSFVRKEMRDDRVLFFVEHMAQGMFHYRYLARATTMGSFVVPPIRAEEMYAPEVFGRSGAVTVEVRPR